RAASSTGAAETGAPARSAARTISSAEVGCVARSTIFLIVAGSSSRKVARVRLRGPPGVLLDSRASNPPRRLAVMNAIVGQTYHYDGTVRTSNVSSPPTELKSAGP